MTLLGHSKGVSSVAFSHDSKFVITGSYDKNAIIWNVQKGTIEKIFKGHSDVINSAAFSHDSKFVITGSDDRTAIIWDLSSFYKLCIDSFFLKLIFIL